MRRAAHRGISLSLAMGFFAPLCIVIAHDAPAIPNAAAPVGDNILADVAPAGAQVGATVDASMVESLRNAANAYWPAPTTIPTYEIAVADLDGLRLATATPTRITIDATAAGYGWDTDGDATVTAGTMDLLTVLAHEVGHVIGFGDVAPGTDLMADEIAAGVQKLASAVVGPYVWSRPIDGSATLSEASGVLSLGGRDVSASLVSSVAIAGGLGADTLTIGDTVAKSVSFSGGEGADTVNGPNVATRYAVLGAGHPALDSASDLLAFTGVETVAAGTASDTLLAPAGESRVRFDGANGVELLNAFNVRTAILAGLDSVDAAANAGTTHVSVLSASSIGSLILGVDDRFIVEVQIS